MLETRGACRKTALNPMPRCRWLVIGAIACALAGCGMFKVAPTPPPVQPLVQAQGKQSVVVTDNQAGASVVLEAGQEWVVRLQLSPATGLDWSVADLPAGVLALRASGFERAPRNNDVDDSDGAVVFRIRALAPGTGTPKFELRRARSLGPPQRVVSFAVSVK